MRHLTNRRWVSHKNVFPISLYLGFSTLILFFNNLGVERPISSGIAIITISLLWRKKKLKIKKKEMFLSKLTTQPIKYLKIRYLEKSGGEAIPAVFVKYKRVGKEQFLTKGKIDIKDFFLKQGWRLNPTDEVVMKKMKGYGVSFADAIYYHSIA